MNFVIRCKNCGNVIKFNDERVQENKIICNCGKSVLGYDEEEIINNLADRLSNLRDFELISATEDKEQEILNEELTGLYTLYCEETDEESKKRLSVIIGRLYLICNRKKSEDNQKLYNAITDIFETK